MQHRYGLAPFVPYNAYPTAAHPPAVACLPKAGYSGRGGMFEGPTLNDVDNICGARTGMNQVAPMMAWPDAAKWSSQMRGARLSQMPISPASTPVPFSPPRLTIGMGEMPGSPSAAIPRAIGAASQPMVPSMVRDNRTNLAWTGPGVSPEGWTPRGGILDGSSIQVHGQAPDAVFFDATRPKVLGSGVRVTSLPNAVNSAHSMQAVSTEPSFTGFGQASRPEVVPRNIGRGGSERARQPMAISTSVFGGRVYDDAGFRQQNITPGMPSPAMQGFGYYHGKPPSMRGGGLMSWVEQKVQKVRRAFNGSPDGLSGAFRGLGSLLGFE